VPDSAEWREDLSGSHPFLPWSGLLQGSDHLVISVVGGNWRDMPPHSLVVLSLVMNLARNTVVYIAGLMSLIVIFHSTFITLKQDDKQISIP